jgi:phage virion morphogenesis protein
MAARTNGPMLSSRSFPPSSASNEPVCSLPMNWRIRNSNSPARAFQQPAPVTVFLMEVSMTGAGLSLTVSIDDREVLAAFSKILDAMEDTTPLMATIGDGLVGSTHRRFITNTDPQGNAWAALNAEYERTKSKKYKLVESTRLRGSITRWAGRDEVRVGTNVPYAAIHQFGGTIKPKSSSHLMFRIGDRFVAAKSVTIPARPFLGISSRSGSVCLNSSGRFVKWISASIMLPPSSVSAR